jgi:anti-sigma B factor antagonist
MVEEFSIQVNLDKHPTIPVISISGEITSEADEEIINAYNNLPQDKKSKILIDFSKTAYINSAGIATLISLITKASETNGKIEFCGLNSHFKKVMDIVGLTDFVIIHDTIEIALK